jgi:hypothetical protein
LRALKGSQRPFLQRPTHPRVSPRHRFKANWLPTFDAKAGITGISSSSQKKIDMQAAGTAAGRGSKEREAGK